ncbi:MAG: hypothetical protein Kow0089_16620 [Desulfobulbaceae bacterium]
MVVLAYLLIGLFLVILQTSVLMVHPLWVPAPDLYYILLAYLAYRFDLLRSLIIIFPLSWVLDILSGVVIGMYPAICFSSFVLLKAMDAKIPVRESLYQVPLAGVCYLFVHWAAHTVISLFFPGVLAPWSWLQMFVRVFLLILIAFPLFRVFELVTRRLNRQFTPFKMLRVRSGNRFRGEEGEL